MIAEWGPRGRPARRVRRVRDADELTGNAIFDGTDEDGPAQLMLAILVALFIAGLIGLVTT